MKMFREMKERGAKIMADLFIEIPGTLLFYTIRY